MCDNSRVPKCANLPAKRLGVEEGGEATLQVPRQLLERHMGQATGLNQTVELGKIDPHHYKRNHGLIRTGYLSKYLDLSVKR